METIFESKEQYLKFIETWKRITNCELREALTFENFILYALLREKDINKCVSPTSKSETLEKVDKVTKDWNAKYLDKYPWNDIVTPEMIDRARAIWRAK